LEAWRLENLRDSHAFQTSLCLFASPATPSPGLLQPDSGAGWGLWAGRLIRGARIRHSNRRGNEALEACVPRWIDDRASETRQAAAALEVAHPPSQATDPQPKGSWRTETTAARPLPLPKGDLEGFSSF